MTEFGRAATEVLAALRNQGTDAIDATTVEVIESGASLSVLTGQSSSVGRSSLSDVPRLPDRGRGQ